MKIDLRMKETSYLSALVLFAKENACDYDLSAFGEVLQILPCIFRGFIGHLECESAYLGGLRAIHPSVDVKNRFVNWRSVDVDAVHRYGQPHIRNADALWFERSSVPVHNPKYQLFGVFDVLDRVQRRGFIAEDESSLSTLFSQLANEDYSGYDRSEESCPAASCAKPFAKACSSILIVKRTNSISIKNGETIQQHDNDNRCHDADGYRQSVIPSSFERFHKSPRKGPVVETHDHNSKLKSMGEAA